jgi:hypothetical protein
MENSLGWNQQKNFRIFEEAKQGPGYRGKKAVSWPELLSGWARQGDVKFPGTPKA